MVNIYFSREFALSMCVSMVPAIQGFPSASLELSVLVILEKGGNISILIFVRHIFVFLWKRWNSDYYSVWTVRVPKNALWTSQSVQNFQRYMDSKF